MNRKVLVIVSFVFFAVIIGLLYFYSQKTLDVPIATKVVSGFGVGQKAVVYKSPSCGCCVGYAEELTAQGFEVKTVSTDNMADIKERFDIPIDKQSCHTIVIGGYFVEGHVPMEAVKKMLEEMPEIAGIGLPRMPAGTPGMPGAKREPYEVYQSKDGEFSEFITI